MTQTQQSSLLSEMEKVKTLMRLTPEERRKEVRKHMYVELKAVEMERRQRVALENTEKSKREKEERDLASEEIRANEQNALEKAKQDQLKLERLQWKKVMLAEEEPLMRPRYTISALKREQQRRREEAELCRLPKVGGKANPECLTSDLKAEQQGLKKPLYNNWVGEPKTDSEPVKEMPHPNSSTYLLFAAKPGPKPEEKTKAPKKISVEWLQERLKPQHWIDKYQDHREKRNEKRKLKAEQQYARWTAFKASQAGQISQQDVCHTSGSATGRQRNSILKSIF